MSPFRRVVSLLLLTAIAASSVEVIFGDRAAYADGAVAGTHVIQAGPAGAAVAAAASPSVGSTPDDCPCLCACACVGAQVVVAPARESFDCRGLETAGLRADPLLLAPFPSLPPPARPPLA